MPRIAVLITGEAPDDVKARFGDYGVLFQKLLDRDQVTWEMVDAIGMNYPRELDSYDAIVITGSAADAHEPLPWIVMLEDRLKKAVAAGVRILGVCFGHQVMANVIGGKTGRNDLGWEVGRFYLDLKPAFAKYPWSQGLEELSILEIHRDHVLELPDTATVLASTEKTPVQMFVYGEHDHVLCLQGHPEFNEDIIRDLVTTRVASGVIDEETGQACMASMNSAVDDEPMVTMLKAFLYQGLPQ